LKSALSPHKSLSLLAESAGAMPCPQQRRK